MTTVSSLGVDQLSLRGSGTDYNILSRFFATKAQADAALADSSWVPTAGKTNGCITGDQGILVYDFGTSALVVADAATRSYVDTEVAAAVAALVDSAPGTLDTLNELAAAINDDANAFTTLQNAINAVQADVDQNESDVDAADAALSGRLDVLEADPTTATALATESARIDAVETEIDTARTNIYTALGQAEGATAMGTFTGSTLGDGQTIKQLLQTLETATEGEITARTAIAEFASNLTKLKNDVRGTYINVGNNIELRAAAGGRVEIVGDLYLDNNTAIDSAGTTLTSFANINAYDGRLNTLEADPTTATAVAAVQADVDQNEADADAAIALKADNASPALTGTPTAPTAAADTNTTQIATTAYVQTEISDLIGDAPAGLNTLGELSDALNDDINALSNVTSLVNANETHIDNLATLTGVAKDSVNLGTFTGSTISDNQTLKAALQALETAVEDTSGTGTFADLDIDSGAVTYNEGSGVLVSTAGFTTSGLLTVGGAVSFTSNSVAVSFSDTAKFANGLVDAADDTAAATAGVAVGELYRNGSVVMIRVA